MTVAYVFTQIAIKCRQSNYHVISSLSTSQHYRHILLSRLIPCVGEYIGCPTTYQTRHFFNNSKTNEDIATKQTHTTDTFLFTSHTTNVLLFKSRCNIFIGFRIIKEMPGLVGSGTSCTCERHCIPM